MVRNTYEKSSMNNARGGKGPWSMEHILTAEELLGHGRLFARALLPAGSSIGWHRHINEFELYYVLSGQAVYTDEDGSQTVMKPGESSIIKPGKCHMIDNTFDTDCELIFMVINDKGCTKGHVEDETLGNL